MPSCYHDALVSRMVDFHPKTIVEWLSTMLSLLLLLISHEKHEKDEVISLSMIWA